MFESSPEPPGRRLPSGAPLAALALALLLAWINFLTTGRWADEPGALNGARRLYYAIAIATTTLAAVLTRRQVGSPIALGRPASLALLAAGVTVLIASLVGRLPPSKWTQIPFKDNWTELFQQAVIGVELLQRGVVVGWNWWLLGGYPTSTDIAQNFGVIAFVPMAMFGETLGYHVLHAILFLSVPMFVWWDMRHEGREVGLLTAAFGCFFAAGYFGYLGSSGDTNSLVGVFSAGAALAGNRAARLQRWWGGPLMLVGLTLAMYSHAAFFVYAVLYLGLESLYYRDARTAMRTAVAATVAVLTSIPTHYESFKYPEYVSFNNTVYSPGAPIDWALVGRTIYYHFEILLLPHRWFNDYRSLANVWLPALVVMAMSPGRSRAGFYACAAVLTQLLLRFNTSEVGAMFDRIQHMFPLLTAPALAGFVLRYSGTRCLGIAVSTLIALYVQTDRTPVRHVPTLRAFDPALIDRVAASDGMVLVEISPHRDMDADPVRRTPITPFDVHFEGLLPRLAGQRFYSQMIDGWGWSVWRGQVVGAGTFRGVAIDETPPAEFAAEMTRWGVKHLFVWTDATRDYLQASGRFVERWRGGLWSHFEMADGDTRSVVTPAGAGELRNLDLLGGDVALDGVRAGDEIVMRANYYPAWRAYADGREVILYPAGGQLAFRAPTSGTYVVRLEYPRYRAINILAVVTLLTGLTVMSRLSLRPRRLPRFKRAPDRDPAAGGAGMPPPRAPAAPR